MTGVLSAFAQKINIPSSKSLRPRTGHRSRISLILTAAEDNDRRFPDTPVQSVDPSELPPSEIPEDALLGYSWHFVGRNDASPGSGRVCSSTSCPSLTDLAAPNPSLWAPPAGVSLSGSSDALLCSLPKVPARTGSSPPSPLPDVARQEVTLAQRRGVKRLFTLQSGDSSPSLSRLKVPFSPLSPLSPRFAFSILRRTDPDAAAADSIPADISDKDAFDPFSHTSPSVFYDDDGRPSYDPPAHAPPSRLEPSSEPDVAEIKAQSPLNDISVYLYRPLQHHADKPSKQGKSGLHMWVSGIHPPSPTTGIDQAYPHTATQLRAPPRASVRKESKPKLRPPIIPDQVAQREVADAQQEPVVSSTRPSSPVRPLILPQDAAHHEASSPPASSSPDTASDSDLDTPEPVTSSDPAPDAEGARRLSRVSISEPGTRCGNGGGTGTGTGARNAGVVPQGTEEEFSQPQHPVDCSASLPQDAEQPSQVQEPQQTRGEAQGLLQHRQASEKPLPKDPLDKPLPDHPLEKPLPQVPQSEARLEGLISLLHRDGVIVDSTKSLHALAGSCASCDAEESGRSSCAHLRNPIDLRGALAEAVNDRAGHEFCVANSASVWSIATQAAYYAL